MVMDLHYSKATQKGTFVVAAPVNGGMQRLRTQTTYQ